MKKLYDAGAGRRIRKSIGLRKKIWEKLEELCVSEDLKKSEYIERLIIRRHREKTNP